MPTTPPSSLSAFAPRLLAALALLAVGGACDQTVGGGGSDPQDVAELCVEADAHLQECLGESGIDTATCTEDDALAVLDSSCDDLLGQTSDGFGSRFLCGLGLKCQCPPETGAPDFQILDDDSDAFGCGGPCRSSDTGGFEGGGYHYGAPNHGVNAAWHIPVDAAGTFHLRAFMPVHDGAGTANFAVNTCSDFTQIEDVHQDVSEADWVDLGDFALEPGAELRVGGGSGSAFLMDAIEVERVSTGN